MFGNNGKTANFSAEERNEALKEINEAAKHWTTVPVLTVRKAFNLTGEELLKIERYEFHSPDLWASDLMLTIAQQKARERLGGDFAKRDSVLAATEFSAAPGDDDLMAAGNILRDWNLYQKAQKLAQELEEKAKADAERDQRMKAQDDEIRRLTAEFYDAWIQLPHIKAEIKLVEAYQSQLEAQGSSLPPFVLDAVKDRFLFYKQVQGAAHAGAAYVGNLMAQRDASGFLRKPVYQQGHTDGAI